MDDGDLRVLCEQYVDLVAWVEQDTGQKLRQEGRRFRGECPFHSERTASFVVYPDDNSYHCYGCGAHGGDPVSYVRARTGCDFPSAVRVLARATGYWPAGITEQDGRPPPTAKPPAPPKRRLKPDKRLKWRPVLPVPERVERLAPIKPGWTDYVGEAHRRLPVVAAWYYRDAGGNLLCVDARFEWLADIESAKVGHTIIEPVSGMRWMVAGMYAPGLVETTCGLVLPIDQVKRLRKAPVTYTWCEHVETGECKWYPKPPSKPYPLYGLDRMAAYPDAALLFCEGAKAADAGHQRFPPPGHVGVSWRGGSNTVEDPSNNDWSPVQGRRVVIWPDADESGHKAALYVAQHCHAAGATSVRIVNLPPGLPKGWDLADA